jgi:hypothetical protein
MAAQRRPVVASSLSGPITRPSRAAARVLLDRGVAGLDDVLEMVRRGRDQVDMRATISDAAGPDDNADPLGIGSDPADYSAFGDDGLSTLTPTREATDGGLRDGIDGGEATARTR